MERDFTRGLENYSSCQIFYFYGMRRFITMFKEACYWTLHSIHSRYISVRSVLSELLML